MAHMHAHIHTCMHRYMYIHHLGLEGEEDGSDVCIHTKMEINNLIWIMKVNMLHMYHMYTYTNVLLHSHTLNQETEGGTHICVNICMSRWLLKSKVVHMYTYILT
jgi:hypothetical protein